MIIMKPNFRCNFLFLDNKRRIQQIATKVPQTWTNIQIGVHIYAGWEE